MRHIHIVFLGKHVAGHLGPIIWWIGGPLNESGISGKLVDVW